MKYDLMELFGRDRSEPRDAVTSHRSAATPTSALGLVLSLVACLGALLAIPAGAHPGHGLAEASVTHFVTSPYHLGTLLVAAAMLALGAHWTRSRGARRWMQAGAALSLIAAAAVWLS